MPILIISGKQELDEPIMRMFKSAGHDVHVAKCADDALFKAECGDYKAIVLAQSALKIDCAAMIKTMRKQKNVSPIIVLGDGHIDQGAQLLNAGASCYLDRPFNPDFLMATVGALMRLRNGCAVSVITTGTLTVDTLAKRVTVHGKVVRLQRRKYQVLEALVLNIGRKMTRDSLAAKIYDPDEYQDSTIVESHVSKLRKTLKEAGYQGIKTARFEGYWIEKE